MDKKINTCLTITISKEEKEWCTPRKITLIVNVLGRRVSFKMIDAKIQKECQDKDNPLIDLSLITFANNPRE